MVESAKLQYMHTAHCLGDGNIMISGMGGSKGESKGGFALVDGASLKVKGKCSGRRKKKVLSNDVNRTAVLYNP